MKKWLLLFLLCAQVAYGAESVLDQPAVVNPTTDDILYIIDDPGGAPTDGKITIGNLKAGSLLANGANCDAGQAPLGVTAAGAAESCFDVATQVELDAHIDDAADAHDASAISVDSTSLIGAATDVQALLEGGVNAVPVAVASLPAPGSAGALRWVSDGDGAECVAGGASTLVLCYDDGDEWLPVIVAAGATPTLDAVFDAGKTIDGANSAANCFQFGGDAESKRWCAYHDASAGLKLLPKVAQDTSTVAMTDFTWSLYDEEGDTAILTVDPDAASTLAMYTFGTAYKPKKSIWLGADSLYGDGTQCPAAPSTVTINSGAPRSTFICADNDGSSLYGEVAMPDAWDGGTVTFAHHYVQTAADTSALKGDIAASCRLAAATINNTWGTEVAIDDAAVTGSNAMDITTSAAATPNGTCTAGSSRLLQFRYQLDATGTTTAVATLHHLGFKMEYSVTSLSD
jgi:hypothetical protein